MRISFETVVRDYLALRGESPGLLPVLEPGEDSAVLTLEAYLRTRLLPEAVRAAISLPLHEVDTLVSASPEPLADAGGTLILRMPDDYLRLHTLRMADWRESLYATEPFGSLRGALCANAPAWMFCTCRPMVREQRDAAGPYLRVFGSRSSSPPVTCLYVPRPSFDGTTLTLPAAAYIPTLESIKKSDP